MSRWTRSVRFAAVLAMAWSVMLLELWPTSDSGPVSAANARTARSKRANSPSLQSASELLDAGKPQEALDQLTVLINAARAGSGPAQGRVVHAQNSETSSKPRDF